MKKIGLISCLLLQSYFVFSQSLLPVTVNDVFKNGVFRATYFGGLRWLASGEFYTSVENSSAGNMIFKHQVATGKIVDTVLNTAQLKDSNLYEFEEYTWNIQENLLLLETSSERLYRRSSKSKFYVYDVKNKSLKEIGKGEKCSYATFSPDGNFVAYVKQNNLFVTKLQNMEESKITSTGEFNKIIHGSTDWVYEEEFEFAQAFFWSPDSKKIAFYSFDESEVKEYNMQTWGKLYPEDYKFKYPKAGEKNAVLSISVFELLTNKTNKVDLGSDKDIYVPRITWTQNSNLLALKKLNRLQNKLEIVHVDISTFQNKVVYTEQNETYVEINNDWHYTADNASFIISSEKDGYRHLYRYDMNGELLNQITTGNWEISKLIAVDDLNSKIYYTSAEVSALESHFYEIGFDGL